MYFVYVLKSIVKKDFYKGITYDLERRLAEHNEGKSKSTIHLLPIKLVHVEIVKSRLDARKLEKFFKSRYGREIIKEIDSQI